MSEKPRERRHKRRQTLELLYVASESEPDKGGRAAVVDISMSGTAFESTENFFIGERVVLRFVLPGNKVYVFAGDVKRIGSRPGTNVVGVEFINLTFFRKLKLKKLISQICI